MAKYKKKTDDINGYFFDSTENPNQWPPRVQVNNLSPTGYSYGTLEEKQAPMGPGYVEIDGFPVNDLMMVVIYGSGQAYQMTPAEFDRVFMPENQTAIDMLNKALSKETTPAPAPAPLMAAAPIAPETTTATRATRTTRTTKKAGK